MTVLFTESGEKHGLINEVGNSNKDDGFAHMSPETRAKAEKMKKDDSRKVKARYINYRGEHERLTKPYCRYSGDRIQVWHLIPNHVYELPYGFIKEVNESRGLARRADRCDANGDNPMKKDGAAERIHELVPIGF